MKYIRSSLTETIILSRAGFFMFLTETELITGGVSMYPTLETIRRLAQTTEEQSAPVKVYSPAAGMIVISALGGPSSNWRDGSQPNSFCSFLESMA